MKTGLARLLVQGIAGIPAPRSAGSWGLAFSAEPAGRPACRTPCKGAPRRRARRGAYAQAASSQPGVSPLRSCALALPRQRGAPRLPRAQATAPTVPSPALPSSPQRGAPGKGSICQSGRTLPSQRGVLILSGPLQPICTRNMLLHAR